MPRTHLAHRLAPLALLAAFTPAAAQQTVAVKGGRVVPIAGKPIDGGVVLIKDGKIQAVGKDLAIPTGARVIDATGRLVLPGFVDVHSSSGMDQTNERNTNIPFASVVDAIDPSQEYFEECRRNGVTTVAIVPGNVTMFGGQAAIIKTAGTYVDDMIVKRAAGIKVSLRPATGKSRMSHLAALRKELDAARDFLAGKTGTTTSSRGAARPGEVSAEATQPTPRPAESGREGGQPARDDSQVRKEALARLLKGEMPAFIYCDAAMDVPQALKLAEQYKLKPILVLGKDCHKAVKEVAASKLPVVLGPALVFWETDPRTGDDTKVVLPKLFREAGVSFTFQATGMAGGSLFSPPPLPPTLGTNYLWYQAATAVKYGMPRDEALEALTLRPARVLGIEKVAGSIEPGKDADLVILTGDPLKLDTWVDKTLVRGEVVYDRTKDTKLKQLLDGK